MSFLHSKHTRIKVGGDMYRKMICRLYEHPTACGLVAKFYGFLHFVITTLGSLNLQTVFYNSLGIIAGASIKDGDFGTIHLYNGIVDTKTGKNRHQVFYCGNGGAVFGKEGTSSGIGNILG